MKIIFIGTPEFGAIILEKLCVSDYARRDNPRYGPNYKPVLVITAPDKPVGRTQTLTSPPVKLAAKKYGVPVLQPNKIEDSKLEIKNLEPDLIIVAAFGQILPKEILDFPKFGCLNIHPSLLPRWRGASPIQYTILNGDPKTGVTIILMDKKMDQGPIVATKEIEIADLKFTYENLLNKLAELGAELLIETIPSWVAGDIKPQAQEEPKATYTKILKKEDGKINWEKPAEYIERKIRAFNPWPGTYALDETLKTIKILKANVFRRTDNSPSHSPGKTFLAPNDKIAVQCGEDFLIIEELQLQGKKKMTTKDFLIGHQNFIGTILKL